jgi:hypothetical protein
MDASISFCRRMRASHQAAWSFRATSGHPSPASRGISHSSHFCFSAALSSPRSGSSVFCHVSQMTSISALLAIDLSVMCGTRS